MTVRPWREARFVTVAVLLAVLATACGGAAGPPKHFTRVETGWMTIDIPEDWVPVKVDDEPWTEGYADAADDSATLLLTISPTYSESSTARRATSDVVDPAQMLYPGYRLVPSEEGSQDDFLHHSSIRFTYPGSGGRELEGIVWGVADDAQRAVVVQLSGEGLDEDLLTTIGDSIKITEE